MQTTIQLTSSYKDNDSLVLLLGDKGAIPPGILTKDEGDFVKKEFSADRKIVLINQYRRFIILFKPDYKQPKTDLLEACRKAGDTFQENANRYKQNKVVIVDEGRNGNNALAIAEGMALGNYQFLKYRTIGKKKKEHSLSQIAIRSKNLKAQKVAHLQCVIDAVYEARTLVNEPQSWLNATKLSSEFQRLGKSGGFKVSVFNKQQIKSMKMGGLLAVNLGSQEPPTFTVMEYKPSRPKNKKPFVLIGKGVVFDTGGLSLKPTPNSMDYMKCDMAGGAAVACALYAIAKAKLPVHVVAIVPATDNRPGENAYVPGDVLTMMSGQTVEMLNADAEGRLILADAIHFAKRYRPELILDFATLTGAAAAAVGPFGMVCMGTVKGKMRDRLLESGDNVYERLAPFPFWDDYDELLNSDIADMKNVGGPNGGAITAGKFLQRFLDNSPWMHFDIAGPAYLQTSSSYRGKNGTGYGVRFLFDFFSNF